MFYQPETPAPSADVTRGLYIAYNQLSPPETFCLGIFGRAWDTLVSAMRIICLLFEAKSQDLGSQERRSPIGGEPIT